MLDASPFPMILWDTVRDAHGTHVNCRYVDCNTAAVGYLRRPRAEIVGNLLTDLFHGEAADTALAWARETVETGTELVLEGQPLTSAVTGDERRFDVHLTPVNDGVLFMWRDVTEAYHAAEALRASEETLRVVMDTAPVAMNLTAADGSFIRVNPAMCAFLGRDEAALMQTTWQAITHPDDLAEDLALARAVQEGTRDSYRLVKRFTWPDGRIVWGDLSVSAVRDEAGAFQFYIAQILDVTELVKKSDDLTQSQEHYRLLAEHTSDVILRLDGLRIGWVSPSLVDVLGWQDADVLGRCIEEFLDPQQWLAVLAALRAEQRLQASGQFRVRCLDGQWLWMDASARWGEGPGGERVTVVRLRNVDDEVRARAELRTSEERFRTAMRGAPIGMALTDPAGVISQVNPALCSMLGLPEDDLVGLQLSSLTHPEDIGTDVQMWSLLNSASTASVTREKRLLDCERRVVWVHNAMAAVRDERGAMTSVVAQFLDVTQTKLATEALQRLADRDPLTGLRNRRAILSELDRCLGALEGDERVAAIFIDVDRFKPVNDSHGHAVGDALLNTIASRIVACLHRGDAVGRIGGDEFLVLLCGVGSPVSASAVAEKVRAAVHADCVIDGVTLHPTVSLGVSVSAPGDSADSLIARADQALYAAKAGGRDQVVVLGC